MGILALLLPMQRGVRVDIARTVGSGQAAIRISVLAGLAVFIAYGVFYFIRAALQFLIQNGAVAYIPASTTLGLILSVILGMIFISCFVSSVGALFFAADLPILIAAPVKRYQFFFAKLFELTLTASWLVIVFGLPALIGYWTVYGRQSGFWLTVLIAMPPYFIAPAALAMMLATVLAVIVPLNRTREFLVGLSIVALVGAVVLLKVTIPSPNELRDLNVLLSLISNVLSPPTIFNPASWTGATLGEALEPGTATGSGSLFLVLSYAWCGLLVSLSFITVAALHQRAFSKTVSMRLKAHSSRRISDIITLLLPARTTVDHMARRELLLFFRDPAQSMQLLILLGLCVIYLYNLRMLHAIQGLDESLKVWWQVFLTVSNATLASFVLSAMCTRLVFPSISLEGTCWWINQVAPVKMSALLAAKSKAWALPVSVVSAVIFAAGSLAIGASTIVVIGTVIAGVILAQGMVRLAVGLGAQYARFDWEHASQLAASFGSLVFMLLSIGFIGIALLAPASVAILSLRGVTLSPASWLVLSVASLMVEAGVTYLVATRALRAGEAAIERRR